ncbi:unnamed protein product [Timema podura]|uniref:Sorting nexin 8 n=1 Tax=Timema podura TaxID=61482 RepID=A0ABN7NF90_TIMPD|nr:unnamed protein product [Timema podura]
MVLPRGTQVEKCLEPEVYGVVLIIIDWSADDVKIGVRILVGRCLFPDGVEPLNFDPSHRPRRQDWPGELVENGMFYFMTCQLAQQGLLQGGRCGVVEIPKNCSIEIDTPFDLELARMQLASHLFSEVYDICAPTGSSVSKEFFTKLLVKSGLPSQTLSLIWELVDAKQGFLPRSSLYKALALVALAQQGRQPSAKLLDNFSGEELPCPELGDLTDLKQLTHRDSNPTRLGLRYPDLYQLDSIELDVVPEKKGLFLKHVEYQVSSKRFGALVRRRYNDFVALHELLLGRFPYRLIPKLPPKRVVGGYLLSVDSLFIEDRRKSLRRWLTLVARHPALNQDPLLNFFLTYTGPDVQHKIREVFRRVPDEFTTSELAAKAKELVPLDTHTEFANSRDQIRVILNGVSRLKQIADILAQRSHGEFALLSSHASQQATREEDEVCEKLNLLLDVLVAHRELCDRHEKGVAQDHAKALAKMLALKKRQMQGVIQGTDAESVDQLESKMMDQENVIANMELRNYFSLHCLHMETQLVHAHLEILATVLSTLVSVQIRGHSELADVWAQIQPTVEKCLPEDSHQVNGTGK